MYTNRDALPPLFESVLKNASWTPLSHGCNIEKGRGGGGGEIARAEIEEFAHGWKSTLFKEYAN